MSTKKPFTKQEEKIMNLLVKAHNEFLEIKQTHPSDINEWVDGIHRCQNILILRIMRRDYPKDFKTAKSVKVRRINF